jgi:phage-related protein
MFIIDDLWNFVIEQINKVIRFANDISTRLTGSLNNLINFVNRVYDSVIKELRNVWAWINYLKEQIATVVNTAVEAAISFAKAAVVQVIGTIQTQITNLYKSIGGFYDWTLRQISNLENFLLKKIEDYFNYLEERITKVEQTVGKGLDIGSFQDKILDWVFGAIVKAWR